MDIPTDDELGLTDATNKLETPPKELTNALGLQKQVQPDDKPSALTQVGILYHWEMC